MIEKGVSHIAYFRLDGGNCKLYTQEFVDEKEQEIERLNNIINELEKELNIAYTELQPNEMVRGQDLIKNIQITIQELKGVDKK